MSAVKTVTIFIISAMFVAVGVGCFFLGGAVYTNQRVPAWPGFLVGAAVFIISGELLLLARQNARLEAQVRDQWAFVEENFMQIFERIPDAPAAPVPSPGIVRGRGTS